jgi:hypothetical protein
MTPPDVGEFPLSSVAALPNVTVAFPGEHWSRGKASEVIVPGEAVIPINSGGKQYWRVAEAADPKDQMAIALRTVQIPDFNTGPAGLGPNEIMNTSMQVGEYVHAYYSGAFHLTLVTPAVYVPGELVGWDADGARPAGKGGAGAWAKNATADIDSVFEVMEFRPVHGSATTGVLTVRSLRGQF